MPFIAPHSPLEAPDDLVEKYSDLEDARELTRSEAIDRTRKLNGFSPSARPMYAAVVDALDQAIDSVVDRRLVVALLEKRAPDMRHASVVH